MSDSQIKPIRVVDFSQVMAGPFATRLLADVGAEVIKVEPMGGEAMRTRPPLRDGYSTYFGSLNAGKRSVTVDLKSPEGLQDAITLAASADVVVENFRPGVMDRLGLGWEALSPLNPRLIFCSISGFGQDGPAAIRPAYAPMIHASSGFDLALMSFNEGADRPAPTGMFFADVLAGIYAWGAIQTALFERERMGRGQRVDVALLDSILSMLVYETQEAQFPQNRKRHVYVPVEANDGFIMTVPLSQKNFEGLKGLLGHPEWTADAKFADTTGREKNWAEMMRHIEVWTKERSADDCVAAMMAAGVPTSRYRTVGEVLDDPEAQARGVLGMVEDGGGRFGAVNPPFRMSHTRSHVGDRVPETGEGNHVFFAKATADI